MYCSREYSSVRHFKKVNRINKHCEIIPKFHQIFYHAFHRPQLSSTAAATTYIVYPLFLQTTQLALLLNSHSFHLQFPATHAPPCFIKPSHPSQKHPYKRTTLLFVCLKTRGALSHFLFTSGHLHEGPLPI